LHNSGPVAKKVKKETLEDVTKLLDGSMLDGYKFIEKFNRDMMDQFMEYQRRFSSSYLNWEQERFRQEQRAVEQWRQEAREHEKQMFGVFCSTVSHCNSALNVLLKSKQDAQDEIKRIKKQPMAATEAAASESEAAKDSVELDSLQFEDDEDEDIEEESLSD
jgi:hypothetical protein